MIKPLAFPTFFMVLLYLLQTPGAVVFAEDPVAPAQEVTLRVRAIRARGLNQAAAASAGVVAKSGKSSSVVIDQSLADLTTKLQQLPYRKYKLMMSREVVVAFKQKQTVRLQGGQLLNVRLLYANPDRIGIWVHWSDKDDSALLDTRMHITSSEAMLTGTDSSKNCGVILALDVVQGKPAPSPSGK